jgi:hypothetical protein
MVRPAAFNIVLRPKASFMLRVKFPFSCVGREAYAEMWDRARTDKLLDFTMTWADRLMGRLDITATPAETALIEEAGWWDLLLVDTLSGERSYYIRGQVDLELVVTEV